MTKRLRASLVRLFLLVAALGLCHAQAPTQSPAKAARHSMMWKATSPTNTVYLLGSIHMGDSSMYPLPQGMESAFAASKVLAVEINIKSIDQSSALKLVQQYGMYQGDDTLSKHIPKETSDALDDFCSKNGIPRVALEKFKLWVAAITVTAFSFKAAGEDPSLGIDMHFLNEIKASQRIDELETADFQMTVLSSGTEQEQQELLAASLKQSGKAREMIQKFQQAFRAGDVEFL